MLARWSTLVVWALAAASAAAWGFKLFAKAPPAPAHTQLAAAGPLAAGDLSVLLGADPPPETTAEAAEPAPDARFQLIGVVTPRPTQAAREGVALIAVDGKPAKAYRVGSTIEGETVLQSVGARGATLGPRGGAALVALNIAPPPVAATGNLPPAMDGNGQPVGQPMGQPVPPPPQVQRAPTMPQMRTGQPMRPAQPTAQPALQPQTPQSAVDATPDGTLTR